MKHPWKEYISLEGYCIITYANGIDYTKFVESPKEYPTMHEQEFLGSEFFWEFWSKIALWLVFLIEE